MELIEKLYVRAHILAYTWTEYIKIQDEKEIIDSYLKTPQSEALRLRKKYILIMRYLDKRRKPTVSKMTDMELENAVKICLNEAYPSKECKIMMNELACEIGKRHINSTMELEILK